MKGSVVPATVRNRANGKMRPPRKLGGGDQPSDESHVYVHFVLLSQGVAGQHPGLAARPSGTCADLLQECWGLSKSAPGNTEIQQVLQEQIRDPFADLRR